MTKSYIYGIGEHAWVNFWAFLMIIILLWQIFVILVLDISHPSFIGYSMIYLIRSFALNMMRIFKNAIFNDLFKLNRYWYAEHEHYDNGKLIYWPPFLEGIWIDEKGRYNHSNELDNQRRHWEDYICDKNRAVPDIITLKEDNNARTTMVSPYIWRKVKCWFFVGTSTYTLRGRFCLWWWWWWAVQFHIFCF